MSELANTTEPQASAPEASPQVEKKTPNKRSRMSFIERAQKESEELVKNMGGSLELEGGRRTRSSARGTPSRSAVVTPPPTKKARNSPASPKSTPRPRGRGRKIYTVETPDPPEQQQSKEKEEKIETATATPTTAENDVIEKKSAEKPEMNGPEKPTEEQNNDVLPTESLSVNPEVQKDDKEESVSQDKKEVDQVDAVSKTVQVEAISVSNTSEPEQPKEPTPEERPVSTPVVAADSPMDVDEQSSTQEPEVVQNENSKSENTKTEVKIDSAEVESKPETNVESVVKSDAVEKQTTPEPMEVDSSSKSSDVIECTDVVDKVDSTVSSAHVESKSSIEQSTEKPEENGTSENNIAAAPVEGDTKSTDAPAAREESKIDSVGESKTENNIDEPKVATSQLSAAGEAAVTTT